MKLLSKRSSFREGYFANTSIVDDFWNNYLKVSANLEGYVSDFEENLKKEAQPANQGAIFEI